MMPQQVAGLRTEPPVSVPSAAGAMPAASAAPEPLDEPAGWCSRFHGLRDRRDPSEQRQRPFHRRELLGAQQLRAVGDGEIRQISHGNAPSTRADYFLSSKAAGLNTGAGEAVGTRPFGGSPIGFTPRSIAA